MKPYYQHKNRTIYCGDCLDVLPQLPANSIDAIVTDPPYGWSFMGKKWDYDVPSKDVWAGCLRVLKPGSHILVCCGTRTQHRMAVNIEDAGFEIRDLVAWVYGSGFPKSLDISKAIDKAAGVERQVVGTKLGRPGMAKDGSNQRCGFNAAFGGQGSGPMSSDITAPATPEAQLWEGWGTALKPSMELWTLARKPLEGTVAENVLKYGTGGLNIDGARIGTEQVKIHGYKGDSFSQSYKDKGTIPELGEYRTQQGRFPANLIHDGSEEVLELFPEAHSSCGGGLASNRETSMFGIGDRGHDGRNGQYYDNGSAARFFYCAKADKDERNVGLEGLEVKHVTCRPLSDDENDRTIQERLHGRKARNYHPTVKPIDLMRYLCRLITPPHGIVLDPFMGSGSTMIACKLEWFQFIGIEIDQDYCEIAARRFPQEVMDLICT